MLPSMTVCPKYDSAYKEEELARHGIGSLEVSQQSNISYYISTKEYRGGNFKGNSTKNEREIFEDVTFSFDDIVKNVTIRFPMKRKNKKGERRKKTVEPKDIASKEIRYLNTGKCFEINLDQFGEPLGYIEFYLKMSGYIYVNSGGQFHNRDSFSKVEVKLGNCLWIELTYEVNNRAINQTKFSSPQYEVINQPINIFRTDLICYQYFKPSVRVIDISSPLLR